MNSSNPDTKCNQDLVTQQDLQLTKQQSNYYNQTNHQINHSNQQEQQQQESTYLTLLEPQSNQQHDVQNIQQQNNHQPNAQINSHSIDSHSINNHQINIDQQQQSSNASHHQKFQQYQQMQFISNNTIQQTPASLPSVSTIKNASENASSLNTLTNNLNSTINTNLNASNLLNTDGQQLELNNSTNASIKMNGCLNTAINTAYYQTDQLQHNHANFNNFNNLNHSQQFQTSTNPQHKNSASNHLHNFTTIDSNQLTSSPSSISSSSNSSNSSPLPSIASPPVLSPDNSATTITTTVATKKTIVRGKHGRNNIQLWQFLKELLNQPHLYENCIKWINRKEGEFRIVNSVLVANLWGNYLVSKKYHL